MSGSSAVSSQICIFSPNYFRIGKYFQFGLSLNFGQFVNIFTALLVISNPLSALPAVLKITRNQSLGDKKKTGLVAAFAVLVILLISTWIGTPLLMILGIQRPSFQVAGGAII